MSEAAERIRRFAAGHAPLVKIEVASARGSTPREAGAWMLVGPDKAFGTIGGGQLEFLAIEHARRIAGDPSSDPSMSVPLGPEIGQCCGGRVDLDFCLMSEAEIEALIRRVEDYDRANPHVYLFGAGHVGHALADAFRALPVHLTIVETRAEALADFDADTDARLAAMPEAVIDEAPPGSALIVLTHDHALDFLLVRAALSRNDLAYIGMIGSKTKRATFERWYVREGGGDPANCARLVSPIGGGDLRDKRPAVIAALVAAEVLRAVL